MSTTLEQINLWRSASSEHQGLEFKEAKTQFDFHPLPEPPSVLRLILS